MRPQFIACTVVCLLLTSCGGSSSHGPSAVPLVSDLHASHAQAYLGEPITFTVQCHVASGSANPNLSYRWHFGDETSPGAIGATTSVPVVQHAYALAPGAKAANSYDAYQYSVVCVDSSEQPAASAQAPSQTIQVLRQDLSTVASLSCLSGLPGTGWCWQQPSPTGAFLQVVAAVSDTVGWAAGESGTILHTVDAGAHWQPIYLGTGNAAPNFLTIAAAR